MIIEKVDASEGIQYVVAIKKSLGFRMGYVAVPLNVEINEDELSCHGGITYTGGNSGYPISTPDKIRWIGFDCGHCGDAPDIDFTKKLLEDNKIDEKLRNAASLRIQMWRDFADADDTVKDLRYVENECISLIKQIKEKK